MVKYVRKNQRCHLLKNGGSTNSRYVNLLLCFVYWGKGSQYSLRKTTLDSWVLGFKVSSCRPRDVRARGWLSLMCQVDRSGKQRSAPVGSNKSKDLLDAANLRWTPFNLLFPFSSSRYSFSAKLIYAPKLNISDSIRTSVMIWALMFW